MACVTLLGFPRDLAAQLGRALAAVSHVVTRRSDVQNVCQAEAGVVFVCGDSPGFLKTLSSIREKIPGVPVVVATRMPETRQWLEALDAGAADYCGAPFEPVQIRWVMDSILGTRVRPAAA